MASASELRAEAGNRISMTPGESMRCEYKPAEVLVLGQEYPVFRQSKGHDISIDGTLLRFADR